MRDFFNLLFKEIEENIDEVAFHLIWSSKTFKHSLGFG
jgi:hypothetical protein